MPISSIESEFMVTMGTNSLELMVIFIDINELSWNSSIQEKH